MKRIIKNMSGFTLVELMVVVAIIGILATVAIPNFKKYQAKAKTSEAKLILASIYSAQTAFMGEWDTYATCLTDMGVSAPNRGYYVFGFSAASTANATAVTNGATCAATGYQLKPTTVVSVKGVQAVVGDIPATAVVPVTGESFNAAAVGQISPDVTVKDTWSINNLKTISNNPSGI